jgi:MFS family permease
MTQLIRLATPVAIQEIHPNNVTSVTGLAFTLGGFGSAISVLLVAPRFFRSGRYRLSLAAVFFVAGLAYLALSTTKTVAPFIACYVAIVLLMAATIPAVNTLIAANVSRQHRGTGFGWAASAQALAFVVGPAGAAMFGAISLSLGFVVLGITLVAMACLSFAFVREPASIA